MRTQSSRVLRRREHVFLCFPSRDEVGRIKKRAVRRRAGRRQIPAPPEDFRHGQVAQGPVVSLRACRPAREKEQLVIGHGQPCLRIERLADGIALLEETPGIQLPLAVPSQISEPGMAPVLPLAREVKGRDPPGLARDAGEVGLVGANPPGRVNSAQAVLAVGPQKNTLLGAPMIVPDHVEDTVELVMPRPRIFRRPLEFGAWHRGIDEELQFRRRKPAQIMLELPCLVGPVKIIELARDTLLRTRHRCRRHLMVRPE